jgi:hypothetical protein
VPDVPALHRWSSKEHWIAEFAVAETAERVPDGQFVVLPSGTLCFFTVAQSIDESHVPSPAKVVWRPSLGADLALPGLKQHHIFLRPSGGDEFLYAGVANLSSQGSTRTSTGAWGFAATYSLAHKLPRDDWITLGGYPGWLVEVNHKALRLDSHDLPAFERLVAQLLTAPWYYHLSMTRYDEDSLSVFINATSGWLMYLKDPCDGGIYIRDLDYAGPSESEEKFRCGCGIDLDFPTAQTLPRELAGRAAQEFFQTSKLPRCVHWEE